MKKGNKENIQVVTSRDAKDYESMAPATGGGRGIITTRIKTRRRDIIQRITQKKP